MDYTSSYSVGGVPAIGTWPKKKASCCVLHLRGPLQASHAGEIARRVRALLDRPECVIVLDLSQTSRIDAAGVGELVRAYNMAIAAHATLQVVHPPTRVRQVLERVGLLDILRRG